MSDLYQSLSHSRWDCKYRAVFVPKRRWKAIFGQTRRQLGADFPCRGKTEGVPDYRRAPDAGPCAHVHRDSAQTRGGFGDRVSEGQERYRGRPAVRQGTELYRRTLLGPSMESLAEPNRQEDAPGPLPISLRRARPWALNQLSNRLRRVSFLCE